MQPRFVWRTPIGAIVKKPILEYNKNMNLAAVPSPRLAAVVHYVVARSMGAGFGSIKLNKAIVSADREFFRRHGRTITGADSFQKQKFGPVPNGILIAKQQLRASGAITDRKVLTATGTRDEAIALREPDVSGFGAEEVDVLNMAIASLERMSAAEASEQTHDALWDETDLMGQIPVAAAAFPPDEIDADALAWANG